MTARTFILQNMKLLKNKVELLWNSSAKKKLKVEDVENYKHEHPVIPADIYKSMAKNSHLYPGLIPPSTVDIERGFSVLTMLHTKYLNSLTPSSVDKLVRLVLLGTPTLSDETWEGLVDQYNQRHELRIRLKQ